MSRKPKFSNIHAIVNANVLKTATNKTFAALCAQVYKKGASLKTINDGAILALKNVAI
jgi:hypothetical protein